MSRSKYEIFNIATGKFEEMDFSPDEFFDELAGSIRLPMFGIIKIIWKE